MQLPKRVCRSALTLLLYAVGAVSAANVDCVVTAWSDYAACDELNMKQTRTRSIVQEPEGWGRPCPGLVDTITCPPVPCEVSVWSDFGNCDASGYKTRSRTVTRAAKYGGADCRALSESVKCNPVDCYVSRWGDWSECSTDGSNIRVSTRTVLVKPHDGGTACPELQRTTSCGSSSGSTDSGSAGF